MIIVELNFADFAIDAADTDEALHQKAEAHLDTALQARARTSAEVTWEALRRQAEKSPQRWTIVTSHDQYMGERTLGIVNGTEPAERAEIVQSIYEQLQGHRDAQRSSAAA